MRKPVLPPAILNEETGPHQPLILRRQVTKPCPKRPPKPKAPFFSDGITATQRAWSNMPLGIPFSEASSMSCSTWPERSKRSISLDEAPANADAAQNASKATTAMLVERGFIGESSRRRYRLVNSFP